MFFRTVFLLFLCMSQAAYAQGIYEVEKAEVSFHSEAPQELISASSKQLRGAISVSKKTFVFKVGISSFMGFNTLLQKDHFNENYMESAVFPEATFVGKIIEDIDYAKDGEYDVRAKGKLRIHGIEKERIIKSHISVKSGAIYITSGFVVPLADHDIKIPRVVSEKLAPDINVTIKASLMPVP
jgi:polyisoprenoid-binding protein YceI